VVMDSGLAASRRPGMTERDRRNQVEMRLTRLLVVSVGEPREGAEIRLISAPPFFGRQLSI